MAIIQIRNAAGSKQEREEMPRRELMTKRSVLKILKIKDQQYVDLYRRMDEAETEYAVDYIKWVAKFKKQKLITYYVGAATFLIGGGLGWLMN